MRRSQAVQTINTALRRVPSWPIWLLGLAWAGWLFYRALRGDFVDPVVELEHRSGLLALQLLVASLCISPVRDLTGINLIRYRRATGLTAFFFAICHMLVWALLDLGQLSLVVGDLIKRPYITVGMLALALLIPLAVTSADRVIRRMGPVAWRRLHRLVYPAAVLAAVHFLMQPKTWDPEPFAYLVAILLLLGFRAVRQLWKRRAAADVRPG